jgi:hypothetical protein
MFAQKVESVISLKPLRHLRLVVLLVHASELQVIQSFFRTLPGMQSHMKTIALALASLALTGQAFGSGAKTGTPLRVGTSNLRGQIEKTTGLSSDLATPQRHWLAAPVTLSVKRETDGQTASPTDGSTPGRLTVRAALAPLGLTVSSRWSQDHDWLVWDLDFTGDQPRSGHEVAIDLPLLAPSLRLFTPGDRGELDLAMHPTFKPAPYGVNAYDHPNGESYVLPLVSIFNPASDSALTIALPPDGNYPHLQFEWKEARTLRITLGHRAMGGGKDSRLRIMFTTHAADYRSVLAAYALRYPAFFESPMPPSAYDGAFWYHHIQDHPDFDEMSSQNVRYIWSSFWFTHLGEYLPAEKEWFPYTYARWWSFGKSMSDRQINSFVNGMHQHRIGMYAYFNVTEYGGTGGKGGDAAEAERLLKDRFANALMKDADGNFIPTWEGAVAMNARHQYALWPFLEEQVRRHIDRLPDFDGFIIDRLDWASKLDFGHDDGLTMVGGKPADNLAQAAAEAVQSVCRLTHAAKKRVLVNQFSKVELMRDVDGSCQESDYLAQRYLTFFRPAAAWEQQRPYAGQLDLAPFEAHLKLRLQTALQPQMIAHQFGISQQAPDAVAADLLELFSPLFKALAGKRQVLQPHCISVSGVNDVNLFIDTQGRYVVPVTSRTRFLTRGDRDTEPVVVTIALPDARKLAWAQAIPIGAKACPAAIRIRNGKAIVTFPNHGAATMLVAGQGKPPALDNADADRLLAACDARFPQRNVTLPASAAIPAGTLPNATLDIDGTSFYQPGPFTVQLGQTTVGTLTGASGSFSCAANDLAKPVVRVIAGDDGVWYLPERVRLALQARDKTTAHATWVSGQPLQPGSSPRELVLPLRWTRQIPESAIWNGHSAEKGGNWIGAYGATAAWLAAAPSATIPVQHGFRFAVRRGSPYTWAASCDDARALATPETKPQQRAAACWFDASQVACQVTPPNDRPYRLTVYVLDYDHARRSVETAIVGSFGERLDVRSVSVQQMDQGVYLTWTVTGEARILVRYTGQNPVANAALSAVFVDP